MKAAGIILAIYLLCLSAIPCCAFDDCPDDQPETSAAHQPGDEDDCGNCSPFFSCEGCASTVVHSEPPLYAIAPVQSKAAYTGYLQLILSQVHFDFWQPPREVNDSFNV